jgi:maltose-binding protein MalE
MSQRILISLSFYQVLHSLRIRSGTTESLFVVVVIVLNVALLSNFGFLLSDTSTTSVFAQSQQVQKETLTVVLANEERWDPLIDGAKQELQRRHPDKIIEIQNRTLPYEAIRPQMLEALSNGTYIDLISIDQIWLGEFAEKSLLTDLTNFTKKGISSSDFYQANWDGGVYENKVYAIWIWTDVRGTWYWKDLLNKTAVDPNSLKTWDGYIASAKKLNDVLRPEGIEGAHLVGADHSPDMWYPYLWMLGGDILNLKPVHIQYQRQDCQTNASKHVSKTKRWEFNDLHLCAHSEPVVTLCPTQNQTYYLLCQIPPNGPKPPPPLPPNPSCPFRCSNDPNID